MTIKEFNFKGQMINYYNRLLKDDKIANCFCEFNASRGCYIVGYTYKRKEK